MALAAWGTEPAAPSAVGVEVVVVVAEEVLEQIKHVHEAIVNNFV